MLGLNLSDNKCKVICKGNRTEWSPIRSVIIQVINKIGRARSGSPICFITSMITDRIGRHEILLLILILSITKFEKEIKEKLFRKKNSFHSEMYSKENMKVKLCSYSACDGVYCAITLSYLGKNHSW